MTAKRLCADFVLAVTAAADYAQGFVCALIRRLNALPGSSCTVFASSTSARITTLLLLATASASAGNFTASMFTGADAGEGLDLDGTFTHAVNVAGPAFTIRDVAFSADTGAPIPNVLLAGDPAISGPRTDGTQPEYGASSADDDLEEMMHTLRFVNATAAGEGMEISLLNVVPGQRYKLQMLFSENRKVSGAVNDRRFDVVIEGALQQSAFGVRQTTEDEWVTEPTVGALITYEFVAGDDTVEIELNAVPGLMADGESFNDDNPILQALTLEIPEPGALALLLLAGCSAAGLKR